MASSSGLECSAHTTPSGLYNAIWFKWSTRNFPVYDGPSDKRERWKGLQWRILMSSLHIATLGKNMYLKICCLWKRCWSVWTRTPVYHCLFCFEDWIDILSWVEVDEHVSYLGLVFHRLGFRLTVKPSKCKLAMSQFVYLGHIFGVGCYNHKQLRWKQSIIFLHVRRRFRVYRACWPIKSLYLLMLL